MTEKEDSGDPFDILVGFPSDNSFDKGFACSIKAFGHAAPRLLVLRLVDDRLIFPMLERCISELFWFPYLFRVGRFSGVLGHDGSETSMVLP